MQKVIIIGDPVEHSLSPAIHNQAYKKHSLNFYFDKLRVRSSDLEETLSKFRKDSQWRALTVTIPHKVEILKYLDEVDPQAKKIGAVNTVVKNGNSLIGYNTDWLGVLVPIYKSFYPDFNCVDFSLKPQLNELPIKKAALIGAGGAARAVAFGLLTLGLDLTIFNRTKSKADDLKKSMIDLFPEAEISVGEMSDLEEFSDFELVFNSTSIGYNDLTTSPCSLAFLKNAKVVFDAVYKPLETKFLTQAKSSSKARILNGLDMLYYQAMYQFFYQTEVMPEYEDLALKELSGIN